MKKFLISSTATLVLLGCSYSPKVAESRAAREHLQTLATRLESGAVTRIDVYYIPARIETPVALSPDDLARTFDYRLTWQPSVNPEAAKSLAGMLRDSRVYESNRNGDIRLGLVFRGAEGSQLGEVYLSGACDAGQVDGTAVAYEGQACSWVRHALSGVL